MDFIWIANVPTQRLKYGLNKGGLGVLLSDAAVFEAPDLLRCCLNCPRKNTQTVVCHWMLPTA
jgi:hypothetical protein